MRLSKILSGKSLYLAAVIVFLLGFITGNIVSVLPGNKEEVKARAIDLNNLSKIALEKQFDDSELTRLVKLGAFDISLIKITQDIEMHYHPTEDHFLIVVSGTAEGKSIAGETVSIGPGWYIQIPKGMQHSLKKIGIEPLVMIQFSSPAFNSDLTKWTKP